ncbi:hypothetical protein CMV_020577 [Castanea mollissima]|uniref:Uncharacterized protein n=1 Tax=Castanea mollissima TaxID=60419 RepID=A0A8J4QHF9_9ROSI|nr:hypothetical protein CMV_020577 [Castanea mollissima]
MEIVGGLLGKLGRRCYAVLCLGVLLLSLKLLSLLPPVSSSSWGLNKQANSESLFLFELRQSSSWKTVDFTVFCGHGCHINGCLS